MSIYAAVFYILAPILIAAVVVLVKTVVTERRALRRHPVQLSLPTKEHDERLTHVG